MLVVEMDSFSIFVLCLFGIWTLNAMHIRWTRRRIIRDLTEEGKSAEDIAKVMEAYKE